MVGVRCVSGHAGVEVLGDEGGPWFAEDGCDDFAVGDEQLLEEALVCPAADLWAAESVDLVAVAEQFEGLVEGLLDLGVDHLGGAEDAVGLFQFVVDALVLVAGEVAGDGAGDDAAGEALALSLQFGDAGPRPGDLGLGAFVLLVEFDFEPGADGVFESVREADGGVVPLYGLFDSFDGQVALSAGRAALVAAEAVEVGGRGPWRG
jgi:hypothetical protein